MCTLTLLARRDGYALGMNRDEKRTRLLALPPARHRLDGRDALFPAEPSGGTWLGVNDAGTTLALINWYSVSAQVAGRSVSRGEVVKRTLPCDSADLVDMALTELPLARMNPFRLIGVFPFDHELVEWRWNRVQLERLVHPWQTNTWISSGFDEPGAQQTRGQVFAEALRETPVQNVQWLRRLHRSHGAEGGPYSHCMHRTDAATVSYTEVVVSRHEATMRYICGAPCTGVAMTARRLRLNPVAAGVIRR